MKKLIVIILLVLISSLGIAYAQQYNVGDIVSDFTLPEAFGGQVSLSDYYDRIVILFYWETD